MLYKRRRWWKWCDIFLTDVTSPQFIASTTSPSEKTSWFKIIFKIIKKYIEASSLVRCRTVLFHGKTLQPIHDTFRTMTPAAKFPYLGKFCVLADQESVRKRPGKSTEWISVLLWVQALKTVTCSITCKYQLRHYFNREKSCRGLFM